MHTLARRLVACTLIAATGLASAGPRYHGHPHRHHHHHHHHHRGPGVGLAVGLALAVPLIALAHRAERAPEVVYVPPPPPPPVVHAPSRPAPIVYPRDGQSPGQQEFDSRECNRWATTQPAAMADAGVFHRAVEACMDGRGYTLR